MQAKHVSFNCDAAMVALLLGAAACSANESERCGANAQAIYAGMPDAASLGLAGLPSIAPDVVAVVTLRNGELDELCSGTLIGSHTVLTAGHCGREATPSAMAVSMGPVERGLEEGSCSERVRYGVLRVTRHPSKDLMLVSSPIPASVFPAALARTPVVVGENAVIAGYGLTERKTAGTCQFAATTITQLDSDIITVRSLDGVGACAGDSGGPLFVSMSPGNWSLAGVLSAGSASCNGEDLYTDVRDLAAWIAASEAE